LTSPFKKANEKVEGRNGAESPEKKTQGLPHQNSGPIFSFKTLESRTSEKRQLLERDLSSYLLNLQRWIYMQYNLQVNTITEDQL